MINQFEKDDHNSFILQLASTILNLFKNKSIEIRVLGGIGVYYSCPDYLEVINKFREPFSDIDFIVRKNDVDKVIEIFEELEFEEDKYHKVHFGYQRRIFYTKENISIEIYLENLFLCQEVKIGPRILLNYPSLSPTDLFLSKIQRIGLSKKDIFDLDILLLQHNLSSEDDGNINVKYISILCSKDWRWWKTFNKNISEIQKSDLNILDMNEIKKKLKIIEVQVNIFPKSLFWKFRNIVGEKINWYKKVDD